MSASEVIPNLRNPIVQKRMKSLFTYSFLILLLPLGSMFLLKSFLFEGYFGLQSRDSMLYSAIVAVLMVHLVLALWIYTAWEEPSEFEKED
ncbi:hypothetical protein Mgra_00008186 [Meloidogyne graminicola]|uniref:Vacuolar ATPase assembly integral membrane protein VMA21 homolog n=1 Tax=Meloidogyne graminicola TaxID=189291 RepID=A0A8S9ZGF8_9BILA|nr:hypothetical protein Mgra_00008186 [Meloidogyne graminicola]